MPVTLSEKERKALRRLAHHRRPVVIVGAAGVTDAVVAELDRALARHELLKVRVNAPDRKARDAMIAELCARTDAALVQRVGHVAVLYRPAPEG